MYAFFQSPKVGKVQKGNYKTMHEYVPTHFTSFLPFAVSHFLSMFLCVSH